MMLSFAKYTFFYLNNNYKLYEKIYKEFEIYKFWHLTLRLDYKIYIIYLLKYIFFISIVIIIKK